MKFFAFFLLWVIGLIQQSQTQDVCLSSPTSVNTIFQTVTGTTLVMSVDCTANIQNCIPVTFQAAATTITLQACSDTFFPLGPVSMGICSGTTCTGPINQDSFTFATLTGCPFAGNQMEVVYTAVVGEFYSYCIGGFVLGAGVTDSFGVRVLGSIPPSPSSTATPTGTPSNSIGASSAPSGSPMGMISATPSRSSTGIISLTPSISISRMINLSPNPSVMNNLPIPSCDLPRVNLDVICSSVNSRQECRDLATSNCCIWLKDQRRRGRDSNCAYDCKRWKENEDMCKKDVNCEWESRFEEGQEGQKFICRKNDKWKDLNRRN